MNFTSINTLSFADVPDSQRAGASALAAMINQVSVAMGVALAASVLGASQTFRGATTLALVDFHTAWIVIGLVMAVATLTMMRLKPNAGGHHFTKALTPRPP